MSEERRALQPPEGFLEVTATLESRGYQGWAVGGAVRDELLGQHRSDWDAATDARPEDVRRVFRRTVPIGIEHGTVGVIASDGAMYEVTTFRRDVETDGRHAVVRFAETIEEDLSRRDFTINALAWRPATEELRDPFGGREDLRAGVLRAVGEPEQRFAEDYLRALRGLRFAGRYALRIDARTAEALSEAVPRTNRLSAERVREELTKVVAGPRPSAALALYGEYGILDVWYPEVAATAGRPEYQMSLDAVDRIPAVRRLLRIARWWLSVGGEAEERVAKGRAMALRLRFSNAETARLAHLLRHAEPLPGPTDSDAEIRRWLAEVGVEAARDLFRLHFAGARARGATQTERWLLHAWRRVHAQQLARPPLTLREMAIGGRELLDLGADEGPAIGILLDELHARVLEDPSLNEAGRLRELARELIELGGLGSNG